MSWFNSLGKQAYSSHVSINVNYPGSWSCLRVALCCSLAWLLQHRIQYGICQCRIKWGMWSVVWTIRAALSRPGFSIMERALRLQQHWFWIHYWSTNGSGVWNHCLIALNYGFGILHSVLILTLTIGCEFEKSESHWHWHLSCLSSP